MAKQDALRVINQQPPVRSGSLSGPSVTSVQYLSITGPYTGDLQIRNRGRLIVGDDPDSGARGVMSPDALFGYNADGDKRFAVYFGDRDGYEAGDFWAGNLGGNHLFYDTSANSLGIYTLEGAGFIAEGDGTLRVGYADGPNLQYDASQGTLSMYDRDNNIKVEIDSDGNASFDGYIYAAGGRIYGTMAVDSRLRAGNVDGPAVYLGLATDENGNEFSEILATDAENVPWFHVRAGGADDYGHFEIGRPGDYPQRLEYDGETGDLTFDGTIIARGGEFTGTVEIVAGGSLTIGTAITIDTDGVTFHLASEDPSTITNDAEAISWISNANSDYFSYIRGSYYNVGPSGSIYVVSEVPTGGTANVFLYTKENSVTQSFLALGETTLSLTVPGQADLFVAASSNFSMRAPLSLDNNYLENWTTSVVKATDGDGLFLVDDGDNGIFVQDGGFVGIGEDTPINWLHITASNAAIIRLQGDLSEELTPICGAIDFAEGTEAYGAADAYGFRLWYDGYNNILNLNSFDDEDVDTRLNIHRSTGKVGINLDQEPTAQLYVKQDVSDRTIPGVIVQQSDVSEPAIQITNQLASPGADQDIVILKVDVTGPPTLTWDESETAFSTNVALVPSGDSSLNLGSSSLYWQYGYIDRLYVNSTAYIDGGTAAQIDLVGNTIYMKNTADVNMNVNFDSGATATKQSTMIFRDQGTAKWAWVKDASNHFYLYDYANAAYGIRFSSAGLVGIGAAGGGAKVLIDQASATGAISVLTLDQADVSEEFIKFIGTAAASTLTQSIVAVGDVSTATVAGYVKVYVQDDGNQITDQAYYMPVYTLA